MCVCRTCGEEMQMSWRTCLGFSWMCQHVSAFPMRMSIQDVLFSSHFKAAGLILVPITVNVRTHGHAHMSTHTFFRMSMRRAARMPARICPAHAQHVPTCMSMRISRACPCTRTRIYLSTCPMHTAIHVSRHVSIHMRRNVPIHMPTHMPVHVLALVSNRRKALSVGQDIAPALYCPPLF